MYQHLTFSSFLFLLVCSQCTTTEEETLSLDFEKATIEKELQNLLQVFYPRIVDTLNGGYWTNFEEDWTQSTEQPKMLVTQARGLWTAARAAGYYPENTAYAEAAHHGYRFLTEQLWDTLNGGFHQYDYRFSEKLEIDHKSTYGNAFALYGIAEYAKINSSEEVKQWVEKAFNWLNTNAYDSIHSGYNTFILKDEIRFNPDPEVQAKIMELGWGTADGKDQNSSIHLLEALTTTYQVLPTPATKAKLETMLHLVRDTMVNDEGYLHLFFTKDWQAINHQDSSRAFILENIRYDHRSFGHDIETAFLLVEASKTLYGEIDQKTLTIAKKLMDHTIKYGFAKDYYGLFDKGYQFDHPDIVEVVNSQKVWWAQAEAWHALVLFHYLFPEESEYTHAANRMWDYIDMELIDHKYGGWYLSGLDESPASKSGKKAQPWKGAYHDGRSLIRVVEYFNEQLTISN